MLFLNFKEKQNKDKSIYGCYNKCYKFSIASTAQVVTNILLFCPILFSFRCLIVN